MRRWNGWGDESHSYEVPEKSRAALSDWVGAPTPAKSATLAEVLATVPQSRVAAAPFLSFDAEDRLRHARGQSFGVWVALLDRGGQSSSQAGRLRYHDTLWAPALQHAFPAGPGHQRKTNRGLRVVQSLRNRVGHHEKIFNEPFKDTQFTLSGLHQHCLQVAGWVSTDRDECPVRSIGPRSSD